MNDHTFVEVMKGGALRASLFACTPLKVAAFLVCLLFLSVSGVKAQNTAQVYGVVTDPSGAAVPGAKVTITNVGTNVARSTVTSVGGNYSFALLRVGTYSVAVEAKGFKQFQASDITLGVGDHVRVDAELQVGAVTQSVVVSASTAPVLQTASATVSSLITPTAVQNLPLNGRLFMNLVQLSPGVSQGVQSSFYNGSRPDDRRLATGASANALPGSYNNYLLDGMDDNERAIATIIVEPSIDALQEVRVETNDYSAAVGRAGGAVIIMNTKSGTNNFHGDVFEFARNAVFDAKDYFNTGARPAFTQNNFGGSLGGPILRNKAFFFADYEGLRINQGQTYTSFIPTPCELGRATCNGVKQIGNFSDISTPIYIPGTGGATPPVQYDYKGILNLMPPPGSGQPGAISTISQNYAYLEPTVSGCAVGPCPFVYSPSKTQDFNNADARVDYHYGAKQSFFGRYTINNGNSIFPGALPGAKVPGINYTVYGNAAVPIGGIFPGTNYARQQNITLGWDDVLRPTLLLDVRASFSRYVSESTANNAAHNVNTDFGGPAGVDIPGIAGANGLALLSFQNGGYSSLGDQFALPTSYWDTNYQYAADVSWTHGAHTVKFGASVLRRDWETGQQLFKGWFQFDSSTTSGGNAADGNSFASFLAGQPAFVLQNLNLNFPSYRNWEVGEYVEDDWQVSHNITLNLGIRYDVFTPLTEKHNTISNFDPTNLAVLESGRIQVAGELGVPPTVGIKTQWNQLQPRLGIAAVIGPGLVLRAGFGTSYFPGNSASPATLRNQPWGYSFVAPNGRPFSDPLPTPSLDPTSVCLIAACGAGPNSNSISRGMEYAFRNALVYMYNITLQKAFGANALSVGWVGEPGRHLPRIIPNADLPGAPGETGCMNVSEPGPCQPFYQQLPLTSGIQLLASDGSSSYNALNVIFNRRFSKGLTFQANYTYTAALANTGSPTGACDTCGIDPFNPRSDWGFSDYDVRHRLAITADYQLPFGKSLTGVAGQAFKGWEVNGIYSFQSGLPFTVEDGLNQSGVVQAQGNPDRPNMVSASYTSHAPVLLNGAPAIQWFNPADFTLQKPGFNGNEERNQLFSPAEKDFDFSLFKNFAIREKMTLQFRAEVFNLTNTPSFAPPVNTISAYAGGPGSPATTAGQFSYVTATNAFYTPRAFQFAVKFLF